MSRSGDWYDLRSSSYTEMLTKVLEKFRAELDKALEPVNRRLTILEEEIVKIKGVDAQTGETEQGGTTEIESDETRVSYRRTLIQLRYLNIALRGYHSLLKELGLPKEAGVLLRRLEDLQMSVIRLIQMLYFMRTLMFAQMGPLGWVIIGGMLAGTLAYTGRGVGGF